MADCTLFDRIISGEIPSYRVYEDDQVFAFLDIGPLSAGHTLVVPKESKARLHELSEASGAALGRALVLISRAVLAATGATDYNILQNNGAAAHQAVDHVHFHIIPKFADKGLGVQWAAGELNEAAAKDLVQKIVDSMEK